MINVVARNERAKKFVSDWLNKVSQCELDEKIKANYKNEIQILKKLIPISANGFRGIVLTAIVGKYLDKNYKPLENFYGCNPRAIFEHAIFYALQDASIPCGKSDPLNVAKNIQKLDDDWAKGRRPEEAARAAVEYLKKLEGTHDNSKQYQTLVFLFFRELYQYGLEVNKQNVQIESSLPAAPPLQLGKLLVDFVIECPEGGTIPQFIVGHLIQYLRENDVSYDEVGGVEESVFSTNTTSNKPADIWEILDSDNIGALYEITVKNIDKKRLDDCIASLKKYKTISKVITFICDIPDNTKSLNCHEDYFSYKDMSFQFVDIKQFVSIIYCMLSETQRVNFIKQLQVFVFDSNRPTKTKEYWAVKFGKIVKETIKV